MTFEFLTLKEAAELLKMSRPTIDRMIAKGEIPSYKVKGKRLFDRDELIAWVKSHRNGRADNPKKKGERKSIKAKTK